MNNNIDLIMVENYTAKIPVYYYHSYLLLLSSSKLQDKIN